MGFHFMCFCTAVSGTVISEWRILAVLLLHEWMMAVAPTHPLVLAMHSPPPCSPPTPLP